MNHFKKERKVSCSVPQGFALEPLLFVIYINDIPALFADDLGIIFIFKKPGKIKNMIKGYLESLEAWLYKWRLKINAKKKLLHCLYQGKKEWCGF